MSFNRCARDFAVAETRAGLVGCLTSTRLPDSAADLRHFRIVVDPAWRRRRLGSRLLDLVREQDDDPTTLQCNCNRSWSAGTAFLEVHGFGADRRESLMLREGPPPRAVEPLRGVAIRGFGRPGDEALWSALHERGYQDAPDFVPLTSDDAIEWRDGPGFRLWFAERGGAAVGFCHATDPGAGTARIDSLVVDPGVRGRGIGRALLVVALRALAEAGRGSVGLGVRSDNAPAARLYEGLGFATVDESVTWRLPRA